MDDYSFTIEFSDDETTLTYPPAPPRRITIGEELEDLAQVCTRPVNLVVVGEPRDLNALVASLAAEDDARPLQVITEEYFLDPGQTVEQYFAGVEVPDSAYSARGALLQVLQCKGVLPEDQRPYIVGVEFITGLVLAAHPATDLLTILSCPFFRDIPIEGIADLGRRFDEAVSAADKRRVIPVRLREEKV